MFLHKKARKKKPHMKKENTVIIRVKDNNCQKELFPRLVPEIRSEVMNHTSSFLVAFNAETRDVSSSDMNLPNV